MAAARGTGRRQGDEERRFGWKEIRISYLALKIWGGVLLALLLAAGANFLYARTHGTESLAGRVFAIARRSVDRRIQLLGATKAGDDVLEQRYATISFFTGRVQIQRATDIAYQDAVENMRLAAGDRVRTFANARAEVSFDDGNVLRIKPDSLIVIGDLTENVRTKVKSSSVRLLVSSIEADIKKSVVRGSQFRLEMPTAVADVERARLAVEIRPDKQSQVRVYTGAVALDTGQQKVEVTDRQAVTISAGRQVTSPESLLPPPRLGAPRPLETFATSTGAVVVSCSWGPVAGARGYRLEVATDRFFDQPVPGQREEVRESAASTPPLAAGIYHLRVAAVDQRGRPGDYSTPVPVRVVLDRQPPALEVQKFVVQRTARGREVLISGRTEPNATVSVGGRAVVVDPGGGFSALLRDLPAGAAEIEVVARDRAGNVRTLRQGVQS